MVPHSYKVVSTHAHKISGWTITYRLFHSRAPHIGGMNGDVQSELATLAFKNGEQLEDFHSIIIILQQEIFLSEETLSPTILIFQYMKAFSKIKKVKAFILPTFLYNNIEYAVYIGGYIHRTYFYLGTIGAPTPLTTSVQGYHKLGPSSYINNYTAYLQTVIAALCMIQKSVCEYCGRIGHKSDACIIRSANFLPTSLGRKMNQFNALHGDETKKPPRE